jgi:hypothetical protein
MKSSLFYLIVALCATAQAVTVRSPGSDVAASEIDPCYSSEQSCKWPLSVSPHYGVAYGLHVLLLGETDKVTRRPSLPLNTSPSDNFLFFFLFLTIGSRTVG